MIKHKMIFRSRFGVKLYSAMVFLSVLIAIAVIPNAFASPRPYFGTWKISGVVACYKISALSQHQIDHLIGSAIEIESRRLVLDNLVYRNPKYSLTVVKSMLEPGYTIVIDNSLLKAKRPITQITAYKNNPSNWIAFFYLSSDGRLFYYRGGGYFSLSRIRSSMRQ